MPLQFLHSCLKNIWCCFQWRFILQEPCDTFWYKYNFFAYGRVVFVKGHPFSCMLRFKVLLKGHVGYNVFCFIHNSCSACCHSWPIYATGGLLCPVVVEERSGTASLAWPDYKGLWIALAMVVSHWSHLRLPSVGGVGMGLSQALTSMGSGLSGLWRLIGFTYLREGKTSCHWAVQRDSCAFNHLH